MNKRHKYEERAVGGFFASLFFILVGYAMSHNAYIAIACCLLMAVLSMLSVITRD